jgi:mRNA interferase HigB
MRVIALKHIRDFCRRHPQAAQSLLAWADEARHARWSTPQDIRSQYRTASFIGNNRVVFNIKGNQYRLIVAVAYRPGMAFIKFIGTHADYDTVDALTVEME